MSEQQDYRIAELLRRTAPPARDPLFRLRVLERREQRPIADIFREHGEPYFRSIERLCLKDVASSSDAVIALGGGTFIDAKNRELAEETGVHHPPAPGFAG